MFTPLGSGQRWQRVSALSVSLFLHIVFVVWLLHSPAPKFLTPSFLVRGENGTYVAHLYWPGVISETATDAMPGTSSHAKTQTAAQRVTWNRSKSAKNAARRLDRSNEGTDSKTDIAGSTVHPRPAGSPYGSVSDGSLTGPDVRPALPIVSPDPRVETADLPEGMREGDEIIEITIDPQGMVVQKIVISSLSPTVDAKVLAALENWHFLPATRFGVPIPSKQDVHYHFPQTPRG
jgi:TonB family protein